MKIKIYSGLSLNQNEISAIIPEAHFSEPIKRGDLQHDLEAGYHVIGIVDGVFYRNLAVSPTEIFDALRFGVQVFGSSSMGALRAAEMHPYGMIGVGRIFEHLKTSPYFCDEKLGQVFFDFEGRKTSLAGIDFELFLEDAARRGKISSQLSKKLIRFYSKRHFTERSLDQVRLSLNETPLTPQERFSASKVLANLVSTKKLDGIKLLNKIHELQLRQKTSKFDNISK